MLGFSRSFLKLIFNLSLLNYVNQFLFLLTAIVTIRYLGSELFGTLQYFTSVASVPTIFYSYLSYALIRFVPVVAGRRKTELFLGSLLIQLAVLVSFLVVVALISAALPAARFWTLDKPMSEQQTSWLLLLLVPYMSLMLVNNALQAQTAGLQRVTASQIIAVAGNALTLMLLAVVSAKVPESGWGVVLVLGVRTVSRLFTLAINAFHLARATPFPRELLSIPLAEWLPISRGVYREYIRTYALPLQISSAFAFLKEHLAVLVLGQTGQLSWVAYYDILNKAYEVPRKFLPDLVRALVPRMVVAMAEAPAQFRRQFARFAWLQLGFNAAVGTALLAGYPILLAVFGLDAPPEVAWIAFLFSATLLVSTVGLTSAYLIMLGEDSRPQMAASIVRSLVLTGLTVALVPAYDAVGAAAALLASTVVSGAMLSIATGSSGAWRLRDSVGHGLIASGVIALWLVGVVAGIAVRPEHLRWSYRPPQTLGARHGRVGEASFHSPSILLARKAFPNRVWA